MTNQRPTRAMLLLVALGGLASLGCYMFIVYMLARLRLSAAWVVYVPHAVAAVVVGATVMGGSRSRSFVEPVSAATLGIGLMVVLFLLAPTPNFSWFAARESSPYGVAVAVALGSAILAAASAWWLGRRFSPTQRGGFFVLLISMASLGLLIVVAHGVFGFTGLRLHVS